MRASGARGAGRVLPAAEPCRRPAKDRSGLRPRRALLALRGTLELALAIAPSSMLERAVLDPHSAAAVLAALGPISLVLLPVGPKKDTKAILPVKEVLAGVLPAIWPEVLAFAVDHGILPGTLVPPAVAANVRARAVDGVCLPGTTVLGGVRPQVDTVALLLAVPEDALESRALRPCLHAVALLKVVAPLASVRSEVLVMVGALPVCHIRLPLACVRVPVAVREAALALGLVLPPFALVDSTVRPNLHAEPVTFIALPLARVMRTRLELVLRPPLHGAPPALRQPAQLRQLAVEVARGVDVDAIASGAGGLVRSHGLQQRRVAEAFVLSAAVRRAVLPHDCCK
mmetsp:Transcript_14423/g.39875  ORF Transcript_14423/g.39875 Transcript_14423/m.39875 type:complete len:343 (+) Transcript_14423:179-1207(+)